MRLNNPFNHDSRLNLSSGNFLKQPFNFYEIFCKNYIEKEQKKRQILIYRWSDVAREGRRWAGLEDMGESRAIFLTDIY